MNVFNYTGLIIMALAFIWCGYELFRTPTKPEDFNFESEGGKTGCIIFFFLIGFLLLSIR